MLRTVCTSAGEAGWKEQTQFNTGSLYYTRCVPTYNRTLLKINRDIMEASAVRFLDRSLIIKSFVLILTHKHNLEISFVLFDCDI